MKILYVTRHFNHSGYLILKALIEHKFNIVGVLFHEDEDPLRDATKRSLFKKEYYDNAQKYGFLPLKNLESEEDLAKENDLNRLYSKSIKSDDFYENLKKLSPDIIVLGGGWHELLPERVYRYPRLGCINTHPSLLPEFRGTSITRWQVKYGVFKTGSTIHYVNDKFDTGNAIVQKELFLGYNHNITPQELFYKLGELGAELMPDLLSEINEKQSILPTKVFSHNEAYYKYFKKWRWDENNLVIDWKKDLRDIHYFILSCTQEDYKYLGPIFYHNNSKYFLRKTKLHAKTEHELNGVTNDLFYKELNNGNIGLTSTSSKYILEIEQIQKFSIVMENKYKAFNPIATMRTLINTKFKNE